MFAKKKIEEKNTDLQMLYARRVQPSIINVAFTRGERDVYTLLFGPAPGAVENTQGKVTLRQAHTFNENVIHFQLNISDISKYTSMYVSVGVNDASGNLRHVSPEIEVEREYQFTTDALKTRSVGGPAWELEKR